MQISDFIKYNKNLINIFHLTGSVVPLLFAYFAEYYFDILPCKLCIMQRFCYYIIFSIAFFGTIFKKKKISYVGIAFFIICFMIAFYNMGIERSFIDYSSDSCKFHENWFDRFFNKNGVPCNIPAIKIFGISLAEVNIIYSLVMIFLSFYILSIDDSKKVVDDGKKNKTVINKD